MSCTSNDVLVDELIDQWEAAQAVGQDVDPEELCRDHPELLSAVREQVAALRWIPSPEIGSGPDGARAQPFEAGRVLLDRYRLDEMVGEGGFGCVWRAFDTKLERTVAVKIPRPSRIGSVANDRFLDEARRLAKLRHSGIVPVFDVGQHEDVVFIVSDFVDGHTLADEVATGPMEAHRAGGLVVQIAEPLHSAHTRGFIHRDIKPANILIDADDNVYLTDFGIAVEAASQPMLPGLSGTLSYMAPEQARSAGEPVDARTDVFSLGVVLYELLTGRCPFNADTASELRQRIIEARPVAPRDVNPQISRQLDAVCLKALARDPADRFATAQELADAVRRTATKRFVRPIRLATIVIVVLALIGGFAVIVSRGRKFASLDLRDPSAQTAGGLRPETPLVARSSATGASGDARNDREPLIAQTHWAPEGDAQIPAEKGQAPIVVESDLVLRGHTAAVSSLAVSRDGRFILSGSWDKTMRLWDADSGEFLREFRGHTEGIGGVAFSPDGRLAASGSGDLYRDPTLRIWDVATGKEQRRFDGHEHNVMAVAWAPNGEFVITGSLDNTICRWSPQLDVQMTLLGTVRRANVDNWSGQVWAIAISPDSTRVLAGLRDHTARLIDASTGRQLLSLGGHTDWVRSVEFSTDGTRALTGSLDDTVRLWDLSAGETIRVFHPGLGAIYTAIFGPDETTILCGGQHHSFVMLDIHTGQLLARFTGHTEGIMALKLTPSGAIFSASHDATIRKWDLSIDSLD